MTIRKRNEWLDNQDSDEDRASVYSSADDGRGKVLASRQSKKRKIDIRSGSEGDSFIGSRSPRGSDSEAEGGDILDPLLESLNGSKESHKTQGSDDDDWNGSIDDEHNAHISPQPSKLQKRLAKSEKTAKKSGVVYISRIPPFMKPNTVKHLLAPHAPSGLGRIFLTPESAEMRQQRLRGGGNKKHNFVDGWIEFLSKREAKNAVELLNARIIGGKKGGYYYDDVWNLKYLRGFKWRHLTEQIANENAERASRIRVEDRRERREQREFLQNVERSKMLGGMERKKVAKAHAVNDNGTLDASRLGESKDDGSASKDSKHRREFVQTIAKSKGRGTEPERPSDDVKRVLSKIF